MFRGVPGLIEIVPDGVPQRASSDGRSGCARVCHPEDARRNPPLDVWRMDATGGVSCAVVCLACSWSAAQVEASVPDDQFHKLASSDDGSQRCATLE